jgi:hypothetical protein
MGRKRRCREGPFALSPFWPYSEQNVLILNVLPISPYLCIFSALEVVFWAHCQEYISFCLLAFDTLHTSAGVSWGYAAEPNYLQGKNKGLPWKTWLHIPWKIRANYQRFPKSRIPLMSIPYYFSACSQFLLWERIGGIAAYYLQDPPQGQTPLRIPGMH